VNDPQRARRLRDRYAIVGVGQSAIGKVPGSSATSLLVDAMAGAVEDAGLRKEEVDGIVCRGPDEAYTHHQLIGQALGIDAEFSTTLDNGGASQILSVILAVMAIDAGLCDVVVCGYGRDSWSRTHRSEKGHESVALVPEEQGAKEFGPEFGLFGATAMHAFGARRHMALYGTTQEQLGAIALAFREHAMRNPTAYLREPLTMEAYLGARRIVEPFGLFDCSVPVDAAGAVVVTSIDRARDLRHRPAAVTGFGTFNNLRGWYADDHMTTTAACQSGRKAYAMAGLGPKDIGAVQLYDCYTYMALVQLEDYGFCAKGEGGPYAASGALRLDGALPANTSGGQLSEGHVEGMLQIVEAVRQVRGDLPAERRAPRADAVLVSGHGGKTVCHSSLILTRA
jgi:acetyl-CoA acetyltransferase